jgi:putative flippase GtrA|tara:strand:+ start:323 stop:694 length:372 start_codon:yes stop_codon:yes gene_type:complete
MKITRFFIVGASNTLLVYLLYVVLIKLGLDYKLALFFDYLFGIIFGYLLNRYWTFASNKHRLSFIKYVVLYIVVFILNILFLILLVDFLLLDPIYSQFFIVLIISLVSFLVQNTWVFSRQVKL